MFIDFIRIFADIDYIKKEEFEKLKKCTSLQNKVNKCLKQNKDIDYFLCFDLITHFHDSCDKVFKK